MPLQRRVPKRGFNNFTRKEYTVLNLDSLQALADKYKLKKIDPDILHQHRIIGKKDRVKILGRGEINTALELTVHAISATAKKAIEEKGGSINLV